MEQRAVVWPTDLSTPSEIGDADAPPLAEAPYRVGFEADKCIAGRNSAPVPDDWTMDIETGIAQPNAYFFDKPDLGHNVRAAVVCPAKRTAASSTSYTAAPTRRSRPNPRATARCQWSGESRR